MVDRSADRAWLTPLLNRIAEAGGERAALILGREKAGQEIYIPARISESHWLAELVGLEAARAIAEVYGGQNIVLPPALGGAKRRRAALLAEMIRRGYSVNQITRETGLARSTVYEHRSKAGDDTQTGNGDGSDPQGRLF